VNYAFPRTRLVCSHTSITVIQMAIESIKYVLFNDKSNFNVYNNQGAASRRGPTQPSRGRNGSKNYMRLPEGRPQGTERQIAPEYGKKKTYRRLT